MLYIYSYYFYYYIIIVRNSILLETLLDTYKDYFLLISILKIL